MKNVFTLAIIVSEDRILLGKKLKKIGAGYWNGYGGRVEDGESIIEAAKRECQEEVGINPLAMEQRGILHFHFPNDASTGELEVHVFAVTSFSGVPQATDEMGTPTWFTQDDIPYDSMWPDDQFWLPLLLAGKSFTGTFWLGDRGTVISQDLVEINSIANASIPRTMS